MPEAEVPRHLVAALRPALLVGCAALVLGGAACVSETERAGAPARPAGTTAAPAPTPSAAGVTDTTATTLADVLPPAPATAAPPPPGPIPGPSPAHLTSTVAQAAGRSVAVFPAPGAGHAVRTLANPQPSGAPLVLLVKEQRPGWLHVLLPVRPNGSSGWVREAEVTLGRHDFQIIVELGAHRITVYKGTERVLSEPVGVGTRSAPTPGGTYYVKELLQPPDPRGLYGPYAYGLSGFSNVLTRFRGGDAVIGIHGTNDPSSLGRDVSAGCIRMSNTGITRLAGLLPLGVPVEIRP